MAALWYPGRIPLCAREVIYGLGQYLDLLREAVTQRSADYVISANGPHSFVIDRLTAEARDCLGSDPDINDLINMLQASQQAAELCVQRDCWDDLDDVIDAVDTVRWSLIHKLENGGTDDGDSRPRTAPPPDADEPAGDWTNDPTEPGETDWTACPNVDQLKAEEAIPSCDGEEDPVETDEPLTGP